MLALNLHWTFMQTNN